MQPLLSGLTWCGRQGRWLLVAGLVLGTLSHPIAQFTKPLVPIFIALILLVSAVRIGPRAIFGVASQSGGTHPFIRHLILTVIFQICLSLLLIVFAKLIGWGGLLLVGFVIVTAAAPISGSPNLVMMLGADPAPALRQLVIGTALLPLTIIPVFYWVPEFGDLSAIVLASLKLLIVIGAATVFGFWIRVRFMPHLSNTALGTVDGLSAILMALVVVGLMSAIGEALWNNPVELLKMLALVFLLNFGLQIVTAYWPGQWGRQGYRIPVAVMAGNRNVALFLTALPSELADKLFLFIGCYQFPMYLTPLLMRRFYSMKRLQQDSTT